MYAKTLTAVVLMLTMVAACGTSATQTGTPAPSAAASVTAQAPSPSASPAPSASVSATPTVAPRHGCADPALTLGTDPAAELAPGLYTVANPPLEFTIPEPTDEMRWFGAADCAGGFVIRRANDACDGCEEGQIAVIVRPESVDLAVAEWMALEDVSLSGVEPAELGGATGVKFEGVLPTELDVVIVHDGFNPHGYVAVYVLDVAGQAVVVVINQYEQPTSFVDDARPVVESFRFDV